MLLYMLKGIDRSGMCVSHTTLTTVWHDRLHYSMLGDFLLNQLAPWRSAHDRLGLRKLCVDVGAFDAAAVRAFCTAIAHSQSLRTFEYRMEEGLVVLDPNQAGGNVWWPWLAYALFSRDTNHQINSVWLEVSLLEMQHVEAIGEVLAHNDPLVLLFERASDQEPALSETTAIAASFDPSALLRLGHRQDTPEGHEAPALILREPNATYRVIRNHPDEVFIEFSLPGTGMCWTERSALMTLQPLARRERHPVRELFLSGIDDGSVREVIQRLPLIGEPLEHLYLTDMDGPMTTTVFRTVHVSCDNLKRLSIHSAEIDTLDWLTDTEWTIESLSLGVNVIDAASWSRFFSHLGNARTPLARSLRELHIGFSSETRYHRSISDDQILTMVAEMLKTNQRLVRCEVSGCEEPDFLKHKSSMMAHHNVPLGVIKAPLSRDAKIAFLSATTPRAMSEKEVPDRVPKRSKHGSTSETSARTKLDPNVQRMIMEMAADTEHRVVGIAPLALEIPPAE